MATSSGSPQLMMSGVLNPNLTSLSGGSFLLGSQQDNPLKVSVGDNYCACCGETYNQLIGRGVVLGRCSNCSDFMSVAKKCDICKKHFHESYMSSSIMVGNRCNECRNKI